MTFRIFCLPALLCGLLILASITGVLAADQQPIAESAPSATVPVPTEPRGPLRHSPGYLAFMSDIDRLNATQKREYGFEYFIDVAELSNSVVQLTAHPRWIKGSLTDRQSSLNLMVNLWAMRAESDTQVTLLIVDDKGLPLMKGSR